MWYGTGGKTMQTTRWLEARNVTPQSNLSRLEQPNPILQANTCSELLSIPLVWRLTDMRPNGFPGW